MDSILDHATRLTHRYKIILDKWEKLVEETGKSKLSRLPSEIADLYDLRSSFKLASISDFCTTAEVRSCYESAG